MPAPHKPWYKVAPLRDELFHDSFSRQQFAANLWDTVSQKADALYTDPDTFFARTVPTSGLRKLTRHVSSRLSGATGDAVFSLPLGFGGGKTHALLTLWHLFGRSGTLPDSAIELKQAATAGTGQDALATARVAVFPGDQVDVEKGLADVPAPDGSTRTLRLPWSILAYQLGGDDALALLHPDSQPVERDEPPAQQLLEDLLRMPESEGRTTLVLLDEILMYARRAAAADPAMSDRLVDFFQALSQAVASANVHAALVVSIYSNDPRLAEGLGLTIEKQVHNILARVTAGTSDLLSKDELAEVLRRQFFKKIDLASGVVNAHVRNTIDALAQAVPSIGDQRISKEEEFRRAFPFHPDLLDKLHTRWTNLPNFQQARGVLRLLADALRDASEHDTSPLVSVGAFLPAPAREGAEPVLPRALEEMAEIAAFTTDGNVQRKWKAVLLAELAEARKVQHNRPGLQHREIEQAVAALFLLSQPPGVNAASTADVLTLIAAGAKDHVAELKGALKDYADRSFYLDDEEMDRNRDESGAPRSWRLGDRPNVNQLKKHEEQNVTPEQIDRAFLNLLDLAKGLFTDGQRELGAAVYIDPKRTDTIPDETSPAATPRLQVCVLGPDAASTPTDPGPVARQFLVEHTGPDKPRVNRNALLLCVPSRHGLDSARMAIRDSIAWELVAQSDLVKSDEAVRRNKVEEKKRAARGDAERRVRDAYEHVVGYDNKGKINVYVIKHQGRHYLKTLVEATDKLRIRDTLASDILLPTGPFTSLWPDGQSSVQARDLLNRFFRDPALPRLLHIDKGRDALRRACAEGILVLRYPQGEAGFRTYWHEEPDAAALHDPALELILPETATLTHLNPRLLRPEVLGGLWPAKDEPFKLSDIHAFFVGGQTVERPLLDNIPQDPILVPRAEPEAIEAAVLKAVESGDLWLFHRNASYWKETVPAHVLEQHVEEITLRPPPALLTPEELLPGALPQAWTEGDNGPAIPATLLDALTALHGHPVPWPLLRDALMTGIRQRAFDASQSISADALLSDVIGLEVRVHTPGATHVTPGKTTSYGSNYSGAAVAEGSLTATQLQDLADAIPEVLSATAGHDLRFAIRIETGNNAQVLDAETVQRVRAIFAEHGIPLDA